MNKKPYTSPHLGGAIELATDAPVLLTSKIFTPEATLQTEGQQTQEWGSDPDFNHEWS